MKLVIRNASVLWKGGLKEGTRFVNTASGVLKRARFCSGVSHRKNSGTDPGELIAAAHAGSFSLALLHELGLPASASGRIATTTMVTLEHLAGGWTIMNIHLNVTARLPRVTQREFIDATVRAKMSCMVSRLLRANISMTAKLEK